MGVRAPAGCTPRLFLLLRETPSLLNGRNVIRGRLSEPFQVEVLDVLSQRHFPRFLLMIVQLAELDRVHTQLASHLHLGVGGDGAFARRSTPAFWGSAFFSSPCDSPRFYLPHCRKRSSPSSSSSR